MSPAQQNAHLPPPPVADGFRVVARNSVWALAAYLLPIGVSLLSVPLFTHYLGVELFGLWMVVISIFSLTTVFNLGLGDATIKYVAEYYGRGEREDASRVVYSTLAFYSLVGIAVALLLWFLRPHISSFLASKAACDPQVVASVLGVVSLGVFPSITLTAVLGVFDGQQRFGVSRTLMIVRSVLIFAAGALVLALGYGIVALTCVSVSVLWLVWTVGLVMALGSLQRIDLRAVHLWSSLKTVWSYGIHSLLINIGDILTAQLDKLLIANVLGLEAVAVYSIPQFAGSKTTELCGTISRSLMPYFSSRTAVGASPEQAFFRAWRISVLVALGLTTILLANAQAILRVWAPAIYSPGTVLLLVLFVFLAFVNVLHVVPYMLLMGKGEPQKVARIVLPAGIAVCGGILLLAPRWGIWGAAVAASIYPVLTLWICRYPVASGEGRAALGRGMRDLTLPAIAHLLVGVASLGANTLLVRAGAESLVALVVSASVSVVLLVAQYALWVRRYGKENVYYQDVVYMLARVGWARPAHLA